MPRNIVVFSDGTGQDGGARLDARLSNIYKLYRASRIGCDSNIDPADQIAFYDPGLGTDADSHGWGKLGRTIYKIWASVAGRGIGTNIIDCYEFIINHWERGDRIFIFGFSRGAYTARCVAQVLSLCGVPTHASNQPGQSLKRFGRSARVVAERAVHEVYEHGAGYDRALYEAERDELARRFRAEFGSDVAGVANASPYFIGVFDTVAALGAAGLKRYGFILGLGLAAAAVAAAVSGIATLLPAWLFWRLFLIAVGVSSMGALGRWLYASLAGLLLAIAAIATAIWGKGIALPVPTFWPIFTLLFASAGLIGIIKLQRDSYRYINDFPQGSARKSHHIRWKASNYDRGLSSHVGYARQAAALDETRADFPRVVWGKKDVVRTRIGNEPEPLVQLYFPGNHSDVGGSYLEPQSRLSDVALEWMLAEATSLSYPLIVERSRIQPFPDPGGTLHNEPEAVRENKLWFLPKWLPAAWRQGWAETWRLANGYMMHPSVFQRFAAGPVDENGVRQDYRPHNLRNDPRFAPWFGKSDAGFKALARAQRLAGYETEGIPFTLGKAVKPLAGLLRARGATSAFGIFPGNPRPTDDSLYLDRLALSMLEAKIGKDGIAAAPLRRLPKKPAALTENGLLLFDIAEGTARHLANGFGAMTMIGVDKAGTASLIEIVP